MSRKNTEPIVSLEYYLKVSANEARFRYAYVGIVEAGNIAAVVDVERTLGPVIQMKGTVVDASITDNIIFGQFGIFINAAIESTIFKNLILAQKEGIELGSFAGVTIDNNLIVSGQNGIVFFGKIAMRYSIINNRINTSRSGILIKDDNFNIAYKFHIDKNIINANEAGINLRNPTTFLMDLTIIDNSITGSTQAGINILGITSSEQLRQFESRNRIQRVIQRNSISSQGVGIFLAIPHFEVLDNVINIEGGQEQNNRTWGIELRSHKCSIVNNTVNALVDVQQRILPNGGICLTPSKEMIVGEQHGIDIIRNTITGGIGNGIEIASNLDGLVIEGNEIAKMTLNGIAVQQHVQFVNNLRIAGNHIHDCFTPSEGIPTWWINAAIVLTRTRKAQITGNRIINNGSNVQLATGLTGYGAFYAEQINEIQILDNQFMDNWVQDQRESTQAIIHVPIRFYPQNSPNLPVNTDIQISNNIVKGPNTRALEIGNYAPLVLGSLILILGLDSKANIGSNHFESTLNGPIVNLHISKCLFTNNFVSCAQSNSSVSLGSGLWVIANGNLVSDPIVGAGLAQQIINSQQF
jgi:hypothetical protein